MRRSVVVLVAAAVTIAGCSNRAMAPHQIQPGSAGPQVRQTGEVPVSWTHFGWGAVNGQYIPTIVAGPDGRMWYTDYYGGNLVRMGMTGSAKLFPLRYNTNVVYNPSAVALGSDGKFYLGSQNAGIVGALSTNGTFKTFNIHSGDKIAWGGMTLGPDGNVWFAEDAHVGNVTTSGTVTEFPWGDATTDNYYSGITAGPDGNLWAT